MIQSPVFRNILRKVISSIETRHFANNTNNNDTANRTNRKQFLRQSQGLRAFVPEDCPKDPTIILFPGQGAQFVGMAKSLVDIPAAMDLFEIASDVLRYDLLKLCNEGPAEKLNQTIYCQPAVMVTSLAALELLKQDRQNAIESCIGTAGFSLGEITSLAFAGAIQFDQAVKLVQVRAKYMQAAGDANKGGMLTVLYKNDKNSKLNLACDQAKEWCVDYGIEKPDCVVANYLFPQCKVVSGNDEALRYIRSNMRTYNIDKIKSIPAYGAFHSKLMMPALRPFTEYLEKMEIDEPIINVYSNVNAQKYDDANHIKTQLPKQIIKPVKWEQTMHVLYEIKINGNPPDTFVVGPGTALKTILKQINVKAWEKTVKIGD